jgi:hypothetical protein
MAERVEGRCVPAGSALRAEAALTKYSLIRYGTSGLVEAGDASDDVLGVAEDDYAIGDAVSFTPLQRIGAHILIANEEFAIGELAYLAADGEVATTGTIAVGVAISACGSDGDWVTVVPI